MNDVQVAEPLICTNILYFQSGLFDGATIKYNSVMVKLEGISRQQMDQSVFSFLFVSDMCNK